MPQTGYLIANILNFSQLCGGIDKNETGFRILQNIGRLFFEQGWVNRNGDGASGLGSEVALHPLCPAVGQNRDSVAGLNPQINEPLGGVAYGVVELLPGGIAPSATNFDPLRGLIAARRCPCKEHLGNTLGFHRHLV